MPNFDQNATVYATCRWMDKGRLCCHQFDQAKAFEFTHHLSQHVEDLVMSSKFRRMSLPEIKKRDDADDKAYSNAGPPQDSDIPKATQSGYQCMWQGCHVKKYFTKKAHFKSHVTGLHNPFPLFSCQVMTLTLLLL
jgi:hypothetical protein